MVFDKEWFKKHQGILLFLVNTPVIQIWFRWLLRISGKKSDLGTKKVKEIYPHALRWKNENHTESIEFRTHDKFAKRLYYGLRPLWYLFHAWDILFANNWQPRFNLGFDSLSFYPDPSSGATTVDGFVARGSVDEPFATIRGGAGNNSATSIANSWAGYLAASPTSNQFFNLLRFILTFDTSSLSDTLTIVGATLSLMSSGSKDTALGAPDLYVAGATPAVNNNLANADYGQCQTSSFGSIAGGSWSIGTSAYNNISLNAAGQANISLTGISKFSTQLSWDILSSFTGAWVSNGISSFAIRTADFSGASSDPKLTVTYAVVPTVTTTSVGNIQRNSASANGNVTSDGGATITERGFVYDTASNPTTTNNKLVVTGTTGIFSGSIIGLNQNTTYHVRAYATNSQGTSYGVDIAFTTLNVPAVIPILTTGKPTNIRRSKAFALGEVTSDGGGVITERGFVFATNDTPTILNNKIVVVGTTGIFTSDIQVLTAGTTYYMRAFATNSAGTGYGTAVLFTTPTRFIDKYYYYKVFLTDRATYLTTWVQEVISEPSFSMNINSGPGQLLIRLARPFDNFGEDVDVKLNNKVEVWIVDEDNHDGLLLYTGYISGYKPVIDEVNEYIEITLFSYAAELQRFPLMDSSGNTQLAYNSYDPSVILRDVIDKYQALGGSIKYDASSIVNTNTVVSYTFNTNTVKEALDKILELCPIGWYYRIDSNNTIYLQPKNVAGDLTFSLGKEIVSIDTFKRIEDLVNRVLVVGGGTPQLYQQYQDIASQATYGLYEKTYIDRRITVTQTAQIVATRIINAQKDPEYRSRIIIADNNASNINQGYDIESMKVGQTLKVINSKISPITIQVLSLNYSPDNIVAEASSRLPLVSKRIEDIERNFENNITVNNPTVPS